MKNTNQKRERSISDLLAMAHPERVAFGLSLASSSFELINARMTSHDSSSPYPPPIESMASLSYSSLSLSPVSLLSALALLSSWVNVLAFLSVGWPALRGLHHCKHERLTIVHTFSLLLVQMLLQPVLA